MHAVDSPMLPSALVDYLDDLALPATIFSNAALFGAGNARDALFPVYQNASLKVLLSEGVRKSDYQPRAETGQPVVEAVHIAKAYLRDAMDDEARRDMVDWLTEGAREHLSSTRDPDRRAQNGAIQSEDSAPSNAVSDGTRHMPSSFSARSSRIPRDRSFQLSTDVAFAKLHWRATHSGGENDGYTVLTQLPHGYLAMRTSYGHSKSHDAQEPETYNGRSVLPMDGQKLRPGRIMIGAIEVDAERAKDPTTLEGMAFTAFHSPIGLFRVDKDLSITYANPSWRQTCGVAEGDSTDSWPSRILAEDREEVVGHYATIAKTLPQRRDEHEFRWERQGRNVWATCVIEPAIVDGVFEGYCGFLGNISKHKDAATAAQRKQEQLQSELALLSSTSPVGLARVSVDGKIITVNQAWSEITKLTEMDSLDDWRKRVHSEDLERVVRSWDLAIKSREPLTIKFRWQSSEVVLGSLQPNHPDKARASGWIASLINVTAESRAEDEILNLLKEREASAVKAAEDAEQRRKIAVEEKQSQELLIDVVSHELRGPVSAILQNADMSRTSFQNLVSLFKRLGAQGKLPEEFDDKLLDSLKEDIEAMDAIYECASAQERIANDILGLAQIQLNKYSICPVEFDLATSLRNICRMFKTESRAKGIELKLVIGSSLARLGPRARVYADPARLTQILVNLLSNAIRFTAKSAVRRVTLAVEVSAKPPDRDSPLVPPAETEYQIDERKPVYLFFSVEDTGPGMTEEETGKLFKKFMQASPFTHTTWGGSGLGLWIARNLCELQAGRIEVASTRGEGSIFRCFITARSVDRGLQRDDSRAIPVIEGITAPNAARGEVPRVFLSKPQEKSTPLGGLRVLCCEDNQINRTVLKRQLVKEGVAEVLLACDGQEGIDMLYRRDVGSVDCILMDIEMPVKDGLQATRDIRRDEKEGRRAGHQRIIALTGNARSAQKEAALEAGCDAVVTKPYKVPELVAKIRNDAQADAAGTFDARDDSRHASQAGKTETATFIPSRDAPPVNVSRSSSGAKIETIASSPDSTPDSDKTPTQLDEEIAQSMHRHGEGRTLPPSTYHPEDRLDK